MKIAVIGAGASGMAAALQAAWKGATVTLFERNASVGRKLLVTGSGHCNITNAAVSPAKYTCADPAWMETLLDSFGVSDLVEMLAIDWYPGIIKHPMAGITPYPIRLSLLWKPFPVR